MKCQALYIQYFEKGYMVSLFGLSNFGASEVERSTVAWSQFCNSTVLGMIWADPSQLNQLLVVSKDYNSSWESLALKGCFGYTPFYPESQ